VFAGAAAVMQAVESQTLILYHTDLTDQWPEEAARALAARLPYQKRLAVASGGAAARASLAGIALARRALAAVLGRPVAVAELVFPAGAKPRLGTDAAADFSIAHSASLVGCAALRGARVGFDVEYGTHERLADWVAREAVVKAAGLGVRALHEVSWSAGGALCRGTRWYARRLETFPGAAACLMTSAEVAAVELRRLAPADLFS
jgi:phosphopantetheinyl transferase